MKNTKKRVISVALAASLAAVAIAGSSLAFFTDTKEAKNDFTVGNVKIELTEPNWNEENAVNMYPGQVVEKDPTVTNKGANPALVRVKVEWPDGVFVGYRTDGAANVLGKNWVYNEKDGYYYYTKELVPHEKTYALFNEIVLSTSTTNNESGEYDIDVTAEAVQSQGFAGEVNNTADLSAWFANCLK